MCLCTGRWILICANLRSLVGPSGLEPPTSCLSGTRSNLLSYEPMWLVWIFAHLACNSLSVRSFLPIHFSLLPFTSDVGKQFSASLVCVGIELSSRTVSRKVFSPLQSLTSVFGMGTGGPSAFVTPTAFSRLTPWKLNNNLLSLNSFWNLRQFRFVFIVFLL